MDKIVISHSLKLLQDELLYRVSDILGPGSRVRLRVIRQKIKPSSIVVQALCRAVPSGITSALD